jgi:hypothetical protein
VLVPSVNKRSYNNRKNDKHHKNGGTNPIVKSAASLASGNRRIIRVTSALPISMIIRVAGYVDFGYPFHPLVAILVFGNQKEGPTRLRREGYVVDFVGNH